jgi:hypothetical protein
LQIYRLKNFDALKNVGQSINKRLGGYGKYNAGIHGYPQSAWDTYSDTPFLQHARPGVTKTIWKLLTGLSCRKIVVKTTIAKSDWLTALWIKPDLYRRTARAVNFFCLMKKPTVVPTAAARERSVSARKVVHGCPPPKMVRLSNQLNPERRRVMCDIRPRTDRMAAPVRARLRGKSFVVSQASDVDESSAS